MQPCAAKYNSEHPVQPRTAARVIRSAKQAFMDGRSDQRALRMGEKQEKRTHDCIASLSNCLFAVILFPLLKSRMNS